MNSLQSPPTTAHMTAPLRESPRNTVTDASGIRPSWNSSAITPLKISKHESPLTSESIPNPHFHRLPTQLARRQSSSYNHVKNNALVSNSPFKLRSNVRPSRIPTPSRNLAPDDENQPGTGSKRRQSRGLQGLVKEQVVTKSPFLGDKHINETTEIYHTPAPPLPAARLLSREEIIHQRPITPPTSDSAPLKIASPATPRNPRVADLSAIPGSPSPKSSLVSPRRLHGPRSLSASPGSEAGRRQRRKTVTFDERCDVLEFEQDEISGSIDTEDDERDFYGVPERPSPAFNAGESYQCRDDEREPSGSPYEYQDPFNEDSGAMVPEDQQTRMPRISRDDVRRRLMEQRTEGFEEIASITSSCATPESSFSSSSRDPDVPHAASDDSKRAFQPMVSPRLDLRMDTSFDFGGSDTDLGDMHNALDRLMLGVESDFGLISTAGQSMDTETATEGNTSMNIDDSGMSLDSFNTVDINGEVEMHQASVEEKHVRIEQMSLADHKGIEEAKEADGISSSFLIDRGEHASFSANEDSRLHDIPELEEKSEDASPEADVVEIVDLDLSLSELEINNNQIRTSTPPPAPRKDAQPHAESTSHFKSRLSVSLTLPPLSFEDSSAPLDSSWEGKIPVRPPQNILGSSFLSRSASNASTITTNSIPPPVPPKDDSVIQQRAQMIRARRREMQDARPATYHEGRPSRRRSLSTGDAEDLASSRPAAQRRVDRLKDEATFLDIPLEQQDEEHALGDLIDQELKLRRKPTVKEKEKNRMYKLRERENTIFASSDDKVSHSKQAGDVDVGKAWRAVRRPSDMNEHSRQIKEYRAQQKPGKAYGKVFVKVLGIRGLNVPLPQQPTAFTCTLNNGIHFVTTPECRLTRDARIEQEFELIEHSKLEFTLTLKIRRNAEIEAQVKANSAPPRTIPPLITPALPPPSTRSGVRGFFGVGSSPKKNHKAVVATAVRTTPEPLEDNFARYLRSDNTLARALVSFKEVAKRCDTRIFETSFPLIGQRTDGSSKPAVANPWTMGEIVLQMFRLPPLPGMPSDQLPQSLDECDRGLRYIKWHKEIYHEGVLTQNGGDCRTWRRRLLRVIGSSLVAFNDVTKKATATIDLKKAIAVEDDDRNAMSASRSRDEFEAVYRVERSFRLLFADNEEISFFADSDEDKEKWLKVLGALVGQIPPNPLWAELVWQRQEELAKCSIQPLASSATSIPQQRTSAISKSR